MVLNAYVCQNGCIMNLQEFLNRIVHIQQNKKGHFHSKIHVAISLDHAHQLAKSILRTRNIVR